MTLLLDTHVLLWWLENPGKLSRPAKQAIQDGTNLVFVSAAVVWEIAMKKALGKLDAPDELEAMVDSNRFTSMPVKIPHALAVLELPRYHRDPFDRMLIAQAFHEGCRLVRRDQAIARYAVPLIIA